MKKRYTITFDPNLPNIDKPLDQLRKLGIEVQSTQRFIGTAVVNADENQVEHARNMDEIKGVTETTSFKVM